MAIVEMKRLALIGMQHNKQDLLEKLHKLGVVQIDSPEHLPSEEEDIISLLRHDKGEPLDNIEKRLSALGRALDFLTPYDPRRKGMLSKNTLISEDSIKQYLAAEEKAMEVVEQCRVKEEKLIDLRSEQIQLQGVIENLSFWEKLDIPLSEVGFSRNIVVSVGTIRTEEEDNFLLSLPELAWAEKVNSDGQNAGYTLIYHEEAADEVSHLLRERLWSNAAFGGFKLTVKEHIENARGRLEEIKKEKSAIREETVLMADKIGHLEVLHDYWRRQKEKQEIVSKFLSDDTVFFLNGWLPAKSEDSVFKALRAMTDNIYFETTSPKKDENFPVALENSSLAEPYEMVTNMYGLPDPHNIDPTPVMSPFFWIFFGMMLSDAGYGIIMMVMGFAALYFLKPKGTAKQLISIIAYGGISTFFWGVIFGSWFGDLLGIAPVWFNMLEEPMLMLGFVFGCGLVHLFFGLGVAAYLNIKKGKMLDALFDQGLWVLLITGLLMLALPSLSDIGRIIAIGSALGLVLTQGRHQKNLFMKFFSGLGSLYNITSWLSDVLSYARIFALGLSTAVIAMVFNILAKMGGDGIIGFIVMVVVLLVGHVFDLLLSGLGAYVHTSRLQYIEFFGKFYESGGKAFTPFRFKPKYIEITKEEEIV